MHFEFLQRMKVRTGTKTKASVISCLCEKNDTGQERVKRRISSRAPQSFLRTFAK